MSLDELELDICTIHTPKDEEVWGEPGFINPF